MLEKYLFDELHKRIKHRFKLSGRPYSKREHGKYFKMILREIVDKILDELIDPVKNARGWWCGSCKSFIPGDEVFMDQDSYIHIPPTGECKGDCHTYLYSDKNRL